jgi:hypothetical protein
MMICHSDEFFSEWWPTTALNYKGIWEEKRNYQSQNYLASTSAI